MRKSTLLGILLALNFITAGMGMPFSEGGKLSVSNLTPILFLVIAAVLYFSERESVDRRWLGFLLLFNLTCCASFIICFLRFQWVPNFPVLLFEDVELVFCTLLWWYGNEHPDSFRAAVRIGIFGSLPVSAIYGWHELHSGSVWFSAGMDDKSQGAVLLCCQGFVLIRYFAGRLKRLLGGGLYVLSFLTISRLPVFFAPAVLVALMRRSRLAAFATFAASIVLAYVLVVAGNVVKETFVVYNRLSSVATITGSDSTEAHLLLLETAVHIKFSDPWVFFFGLGPDNFSKALVHVPASMRRLEGLDPELVKFALEGRAPLHSTPVQTLLDYNIIMFVIFLYAVLRSFGYLMRRGNVADLLFAAGLLVASMFYSLHNKPYFYLYLTTVAMLIRLDGPAAERGSDTELAGPLAGTPSL